MFTDFSQVQLQSLKVLNALVSEHLSLIHQSLPLIQHVIGVCSEAAQEPPFQSRISDYPSDLYKRRAEPQDRGYDPTLMSPDPGEVEFLFGRKFSVHSLVLDYMFFDSLFDTELCLSYPALYLEVQRNWEC